MEMCHQLHTVAALPLEKDFLVHIVYKAIWALEPVWARWWMEGSLPLLGIGSFAIS
jgi:hypothetical protein